MGKALLEHPHKLFYLKISFNLSRSERLVYDVFAFFTFWNLTNPYSIARSPRNTTSFYFLTPMLVSCFVSPHDK